MTAEIAGRRNALLLFLFPALALAQTSPTRTVLITAGGNGSGADPTWTYVAGFMALDFILPGGAPAANAKAAPGAARLRPARVPSPGIPPN